MITKKDVSKLSCFLMFLGKGRSGTSLCAGLINCHPNAVVLNQKEFVNFEYKDELDLYNYLLSSISERKFIWSPYRDDNMKWIRNYKDLKVIGSKRQGTFIKNESHFKRFDKLKKDLSIPIKFLNVYRNPFDNIATIYNKSQRPKHIKLGNNMKNIDIAIKSYFKGVKITQKVIEKEEVLNIRHESLVKYTKEQLCEICVFLGLSILEEHLDYCKKLVWKEPRITRNTIDWTKEQKEIVIYNKNQYSFLKEYTWEGDL